MPYNFVDELWEAANLGHFHPSFFLDTSPYRFQVQAHQFYGDTREKEKLPVFSSSIIQYHDDIVVGRMMASKGVHVLLSGNCDYITLQCKWEFEDMIKVKDFEMEGYLGLSDWVHFTLLSP